MTAYDYLMKIIFVGAPCVGKTSLLCNYCNKHHDAKYSPTIGVDFHATYHRIDDKTVKCHMWDTAGQEQFKCIINSYYKGVAATVCMFDVSRPETFDSAKEWINTVRLSSNAEHLPVLMIANKIDLSHGAYLLAEAKQYCDDNGFDYVATSVKKAVGISDAIECIVQKVYNEIIVAGIPSPGVRTIADEKQIDRLPNPNCTRTNLHPNCCSIV